MRLIDFITVYTYSTNKSIAYTNNLCPMLLNSKRILNFPVYIVNFNQYFKISTKALTLQHNNFILILIKLIHNFRGYIYETVPKHRLFETLQNIESGLYSPKQTPTEQELADEFEAGRLL